MGDKNVRESIAKTITKINTYPVKHNKVNDLTNKQTKKLKKKGKNTENKMKSRDKIPSLY